MFNKRVVEDKLEVMEVRKLTKEEKKKEKQLRKLQWQNTHLMMRCASLEKNEVPLVPRKFSFGRK